MTSNRVYIDHLRRVGMFEQFSRKDLEKIARASDEISVPAGSVILEQGSEGYEAYVILSGSVVVRRNGRKIATLGPGAILGEMSLLDHGQRTASAICETECALLVLSQGSFLGAVMDVPLLANKLLVTLVSRIRDLDKLSLA
jgi:CRP/FNR family cyclic AMP-dependent transcriptional regulator